LPGVPKLGVSLPVGLNHIALKVGDIEEALAFYGRLFQFELRGKTDTMAFIDLGDQFIALQKGRKQPADDGRHFGLVVDDKEAARRTLKNAGVSTLDGGFLDFRPVGQSHRDRRL
jgi:lactoylglutathione lyase